MPRLNQLLTQPIDVQPAVTSFSLLKETSFMGLCLAGRILIKAETGHKQEKAEGTIPGGNCELSLHYYKF